MNSDRDQQVKEIFADALEKVNAAERAAYLAQACGNDVQLRQHVEGLLQSHERAGGSLEGPAAVLPGPTIVLSMPLTEKPGDRIGHYKLLQQIGEGGCGVVYMAEQEEPIRRRVALKVIKLGMDTKAVIARFEAERQALALMDHPNIAKVLDAGATDTGRPFFVMELVRGIKITDYCDQNNLSTEERLNLFVQICHAIQHAHQNCHHLIRVPPIPGRTAEYHPESGKTWATFVPSGHVPPAKGISIARKPDQSGPPRK